LNRGSVGAFHLDHIILQFSHALLDSLKVDELTELICEIIVFDAVVDQKVME
jgi:hypothetical protein